MTTWKVALVAGLLSGTAAAQASDALPTPGQHAAGKRQGAQDSSNFVLPHQTLTWDLPVIEVSDVPMLREEEKIGPYKQPRWTARRLFTSTRIYVRPAGQANFEWWYTPKFDSEDFSASVFNAQYEMEFGLGHGLQLDLYAVTEQNGMEGPLVLSEEKIELRYALADWGEIWGNPTLYVEYVNVNQGSPKLEGKLLLGGTLAERWHGGANLVFERELRGQARENEWALTGGISYVVLDAIFSAGLESKIEMVDVAESRFDFGKYEVLLGPSMRWFPVPAAHIDVVWFVGGEWERENGGFASKLLLEPTLIAGYEF